MAASTTQELTLHLPAELMERIQQAASRQQQSPDHVIYEILSISLPPLHRGKQSAMLTLAENLRSLPKSELQRKAEGWLPETDQKRLEELLSFNQERALSEAEARELEQLLSKIETVAK